MQQLNGKKAVVSGGGSGIGSAIATQLAQQGVISAVADINLPPNLPGGTIPITCDVSDATAVDRLFKTVQQQLGVPQILVCSAGVGVHEKLTEGDPAKWQRVIEVNLMGTLRMIRAFVPGMLEAEKGDVVLVSSVAAGQSYSYGGVYAATKTALQVIADTLRQEVLPGVRVSVVSPGVTDTAFFDHALAGNQSIDSIGYGALSPEQVADAVLYALRQPPDVSVNHITLRPAAQVF